MPDPSTASAKRREMDQWLARLDPGIKSRFDAAFDANEAAKSVAPAQRAAFDATEDMLLQQAKMLADANAQAPAKSESTGGGSVKVGAEVEAITKEFKKETKYGELKVSFSIKISPTVAMGDDGAVGFSGSVTSKDKSDGRKLGTKKSFSYKDIDDRALFDGLTLEGLSVGVDFEISGTEVSVGGTFSGTVATKAFKTSTQLKLVILKIKNAQDIETPGVEIKFKPTSFKYKIGGVETTLEVECKGSFTVDVKKVGAEIGKAVLEKLAKEELKKAAEKQGVKMLGREAGELVLRDLGPLAAAFSVGWDIGGVLNAYTVAPKVAGAVDDAILGDLNERYQAASTLGKMWLLSKNSPRIVAALVASGVAGAAAGISDLVLFKIMGLPTAADFEEAWEDFSHGVSEVAAGLKAIRDAIAKGISETLIYGALKLGIKCKHAICAHGSLEKIIAAIFAKLHPLYSTSGGYNKIVTLRVGDAKFDEAEFKKFVKFLRDFKRPYPSNLDPTSDESLARSLKAMIIADFLFFLQDNHLIKYNVQIDGEEMDPNKIDPKLLDELFG